MSQQVQLPVKTTVTINGSRISIYSLYEGGSEELQGIVEAFVANNSGAEGVVTYIQGELVVVLRYEDNSTVVSLNSDGELIIESSDSSDYYIDADGYLFFEN
jgi:hypothetical protein